MAFEKASGSFEWLSTDTVGTTKEITVGFQPKVIFFFASGNNTSTTVAENIDARISVGFATSTSARRSQGVFSDNSIGTSVEKSATRDDAALVIVSGAGIDGLLDISAIGATSFTAIVDDQVSASIRVAYMAWGGSDVSNVALGTAGLTASTGTQDFTGLGFDPANGDLLLLLGAGLGTAALPDSDSGGQLVVGAATSSADEICTVYSTTDASSTAATSNGTYNGEVLSLILGATVLNRVEFSAWITDGFRLNKLEAINSLNVLYLVVKGPQFKIGNVSMALDTTTTTAVSSFGFAPSAVVCFGNGNGLTTSDTAGANGRFSLGWATSTSDQQSFAVMNEDGPTTTDIGVAFRHGDCVARAHSDPSLLRSAAKVQSFDSDGITFINSVSDGNTLHTAYIGVGAGAGGSGTITATSAIGSWTSPNAAILAGNATISATHCSGTWVCQTPSISATSTVAATPGTSNWTAQASTVVAGPVSVIVGAGESTWQAQTATVSAGAITVSAAAAEGAWAAQTPAANTGTTITATPAIGAWAAQDSTVSASVAVTATPATSAWAVPNPTVLASVAVAATTATGVWIVQNSTVSASVIVPATVAAGNWEALDAVPNNGSGVSATAAVGNWTIQAASVTPGAVTLSPAVTAGTWEAQTATVSVGAVTVQATTAIGDWAAQAITVESPVTQTAFAGAGSWMALAASVLVGSVTLLATAAQGAWDIPTHSAVPSGVVVAASPSEGAWEAGIADVSAGFTVPMGFASRAGSSRLFSGTTTSGGVSGAVEGVHKPGASSASGPHKPGGRII